MKLPRPRKGDGERAFALALWSASAAGGPSPWSRCTGCKGGRYSGIQLPDQLTNIPSRNIGVGYVLGSLLCASTAFMTDRSSASSDGFQVSGDLPRWAMSTVVGLCGLAMVGGHRS